ncbi:hypothetical protein B7494_g5076 [Chlorociboria aeruginascens]|nr:hypothetical protein B7494_g5076 [Chlorociboria aeruginascens]
MSFLTNSNDEADDSTTRPRKRQEADNSPDILPTAMAPPPPPPPILPNFHIKTPRPDITVGLHHTTIVEALVARGLDKVDASDFLEELQRKQILCSDPAQGAPPVRFPMMVIEGKAYATGKPVFEAQNQSAVSGSCMIKIQHELVDLAKSASRGVYNSKEPLAFSICTEGPYMELWVHYTVLHNNICMYNMKILKICHVSLLEGVTEFLMVVDNIISWATVDFVNDIVKQLVLVEYAGRA